MKRRERGGRWEYLAKKVEKRGEGRKKGDG